MRYGTQLNSARVPSPRVTVNSPEDVRAILDAHTSEYKHRLRTYRRLPGGRRRDRHLRAQSHGSLREVPLPHVRSRPRTRDAESAAPGVVEKGPRDTSIYDRACCGPATWSRDRP